MVDLFYYHLHTLTADCVIDDPFANMCWNFRADEQ
jgi:hypothetical protein